MVVTLAVYSYFLITVIGNQFIETEENLADAIIFSFPFMPVLEFFFYMGWLKVAETLINPFGEDDDDFEVVWMIDRHLQVCYLLVDRIHQDHPRLMKDYYWQQTAPDSLPFTIASQNYMQEFPVQSAENIRVKKTDQDLVIPEYTEEPELHEERHNFIWKRLHGIRDSMLSRRKNKKGNKFVHLRRVATDTEYKDPIDFEINTYEDFGPNKINIPVLNRPDPRENVEEFEKLRFERLEKQKEKLLKYVKLLKANKENEEEIVNEIIK